MTEAEQDLSPGSHSSPSPGDQIKWRSGRVLEALNYSLAPVPSIWKEVGCQVGMASKSSRSGLDSRLPSVEP